MSVLLYYACYAFPIRNWQPARNAIYINNEKWFTDRLYRTRISDAIYLLWCYLVAKCVYLWHTEFYLPY